MLLLNNLRNILITLFVLAAFGGGMFFLGMRHVETITPPPVVITLPGIQKKTEIVRLVSAPKEITIGSPKVQIDSTYYYKYLEEVDERKRLQLFVDAIVISESTVTVVDDSIVRIDITSSTRGQLLSQFAEYYVKPQITTVNPEPYYMPKIKMFVGGVFSAPLDTQNIYARPTLEANIMFERTGKEDMFILGIDTDKSIKVGYVFRIFKGKKK